MSPRLARRRNLRLLNVFLLLWSGLAGGPTAGPVAASTPRFSEADYWAVADRIMGGLDAQWDAGRGAYVVNGNASTRENSMLLLTHAIAALRGHAGPTRADDRARVLVDRLTDAPAWLGARGAGREARRSTCWSALLDFPLPQHKSLEPKVAEALAYAWRARWVLGLSPQAIERIRATVGACAHSPAWRYPRVVLNQINWNAEIYAADSVISGDDDLLIRDYRRQLVRFTAAITRPAAGSAAPNLGTGYEFHYDPGRDSASRLNLDAPEYASIVIDALSPYDRALAAGMRALPASALARLRAWALRLLAGSWTHGGYLNWDTGYGQARWNSAEYWAFAQQGLVAIATSPRFWALPQEGRWAKAIFDRALLLARRLADEQGTILPPARMFAIESAMEHEEAYQPRMLANISRAIARGLGAIRAEDPPPLYAFDPDTGRLAVTTPRYSTAILPDNRGALAYGGIEPARLFGPDQTVAANVGGTPPDAFGIVVRDPRGDEVLASQHIRAGAGAVRVVASPRGPLARPRAYPARPYAGPFSDVRVSGMVRRRGLTILAAHRFSRRAIRSWWTVSCGRPDCRRDSVTANFPTYGAAASIDVLTTEGRLVRVAGRGSSPGASVPLGRVARIVLRGDPSGGYRIAPLSGPRAAGLTVIRGEPQPTDPLAGPTLSIRLAARRGFRRRSLAVEIVPFR